MDPPASSRSAATEKRARIFARLDQARLTLAASLGELLSEGLCTPAEMIDAIGFEDLERHLAPRQREQVLGAAIAAGRRGDAFDDRALLDVVTPDAIARALPLGRLQDLLEVLCQAEGSMEQLDDADLAPLSAARPVFSSEAPPAASEELDPEQVELLPPSMPGPSFDDSPTKTSMDDDDD